MEDLQIQPDKRLQSLVYILLDRFGCWLFLLLVKGKRLLVGVEELGHKWSG